MSNPDKMYDEAVKLKNQNNLEGAAALLLEIVKDNPDHSLSHSALGVYLQRLGRPEEAIKHAIRVTEGILVKLGFDITGWVAGAGLPRNEPDEPKAKRKPKRRKSAIPVQLTFAFA